MSKTNKSSEASVIKAEATAKGRYSFDDWLNKLELPQIAKAVQQIVMDIAKALKEIAAPIAEWCKANGYKNLDEANRILMKRIGELGWCPYACISLDDEDVFGLFELIKNEKEDKEVFNAEADKIVKNTLDEQWVREIGKSWENIVDKKPYKQLLSEAIDSYIDGKYASACVLLSTLFGRISYIKFGNEYQRDTNENAKGNVRLLTQRTAGENILATYYENKVCYDCSSEKQIEVDSPGRNELAHGWYSAYPSQKKALNAILVMDMIIKADRPQVKQKESN